ncbi:hypothetical protein EJ06DRAFT_460133, partial [Trichodelitschia bisporula]
VRKTPVVLACHADWDDWLEVIKTKAISGDIWDYVNPATPASLIPVLSEPEVPMPNTVNPQKTSFAQLDADEKEGLKFLRLQHKRHLTEYDRKKAALGGIRVFIQETISRGFLTYTFNCNSAYDMLLALKQRVAPSDRAREIEMSNLYQQLKKRPRSEAIDTWLNRWEEAYTKCRDLNPPEVSDGNPLHDFLDAVSDLAPQFSGFWKNSLQLLQYQGQPVPDIFQIIEYFRNDQRISKAQAKAASHNAFLASFQGQELTQTIKHEHGKDDRKKACVCGEDHRFRQCPYLIETVRNKKKNWQPNPEVQRQIDEKLKNPRLREIIERIQKQE